MSDAIAGFGTILKYAAGTLIGELISIGGIQMNGEAIDVTNHDSANSYKEFIAGLLDGGDFAIEGNFIEDNAGQLALVASFNAKTLESFIVVYPDASEWAFSAIITSMEVAQGNLTDQLKFTGTLKISGKPVFTAATTLSTVTFTITATVGGAPIEGAVVVFNGETRSTNASGVAAFPNVADGSQTAGVTEVLYVGEAEVVVVSGATAVPIDLALI